MAYTEDLRGCARHKLTAAALLTCWLYCTVLYCTVLYCIVLYCTGGGGWRTWTASARSSTSSSPSPAPAWTGTRLRSCPLTRCEQKIFAQLLKNITCCSQILRHGDLASCSQLPTGDIKEMLDKLVVIKLNGALATNIGCRSYT